ncbi:FCD domain-containing protein [Aestuariirhabdus litorea]|uniref:FCD domain-containing protein n=1 Tax=Aestuariirhabdus litorea TaxID=2528527 RepID=A0A3P3VKN8_9GAMM|nr:FCD domain-containing protein [Aestuariirhabdus litorea]RRJ82438.1 FCD domain-containing protein [Aestuariirhabdus litorea]RWW92601.1 FCD domain-containing protein [Endozoicomonadaceae bacterium GTF-13]
MESRTVTTAQSIARRLEQLIAEGSLVPGERMPSERQLSERLGVSRTILREALKELKGRGVIYTQHGRGSFVAEMLPDVSPDSTLGHLYQDHPRTLYDLLEVRELLEAEAAGLAAERGTNEDLYRITKAFEAMLIGQRNALDPQAIARLDHAFHNAISDASHNPVLIHTLQSLNRLTLNTVLLSVNNLYHRAPQKQQIDRHHRQLYHAVTSRQPAWARKVAAQHIRHIRARMFELESDKQGLKRVPIQGQGKRGPESQVLKVDGLD